MKKILAVSFAVLLSLELFELPVLANSAQTHWYGVDSTGSMAVEKTCPIEVTKELLTFDISEFPAKYYYEREEYLAYTGRVTAEYNFYNPTDLTLTATLAFPFGNQPDYASIYDEKSQSYVTNADTEKYDITVNGEAVDKKVRYTLNTYGRFELSSDLPKLQDDYISDGFYSPTTTVTKYTYTVSGIDKKTYSAANVAFDWTGVGDTRIYFPGQSGFHAQKDGDGRLSMWADNGDVFSVYAIGQPLPTPLAMKCYKDGGVKDKEEIDGTVTLTSTEILSFEDLALESWSESTGVSRIDWYNAVATAFIESEKNSSEYNFVSPVLDLSSAKLIAARLMRWYEYDITLAPNESIVNIVTAPIYPAIDASYEPDIFEYTYLLSPASTWAKFGELEIVINTPFYITEESLGGLEKTDTGYAMKRNGLPSGELVFTLCTSENPTSPQRTFRDYVPIEIIVSLSIIGGVILSAVGGVVTFVVVRRKKGKRA